jgi:hypothetical protein
MLLLRHFTLLLLLFGSACAAKPAGMVGIVEATTTNELQERDVIFDTVKAAVAAGDFAKLNAMALEFRTRRALTPSGTWKLAAFYGGLTFYLEQRQTPGTCDYSGNDLVNRWAKATPKAPAVHIAAARLLLDHGWCIRGSGFAPKVAEANWEPFRQDVQAAYDRLKAYKSIASVDPEYYAVMESIYIAKGEGKSAFQSLLTEATDREPYYYGLYFAAYRYYMPQWYGSYAEVDDLARFAAERTKEKDGFGAYARLYWFMDECKCGLHRTAINWPDMKVAMKDVMDRHPNTWNAANFAMLSCGGGDDIQATKFIGMVNFDEIRSLDTDEEWRECLRFSKKMSDGRAKGEIRGEPEIYPH